MNPANAPGDAQGIAPPGPGEPQPVVLRPWGWFLTLTEGPGYRVKQLQIQPGQRLSRQRHRHRHEHWLVLSGSGGVDIVRGDGTACHRPLQPGVRVEIPPMTIHRAKADQDGLLILEVQRGAVLEEEDIERLADDYGRV